LYAVVRDDLERGPLVAPFGFVPDGTSYHLLSRHSPKQDGRVRQLMAWLRAKTSQLENDSEPGDRWAYRAFVAGHARA
jgi:DNA-binding transcriptional LysR family regulator